MTPSLKEKLRDLFAAALELDEPARSAFLEEACAGDLELKQAVSDLLEGQGEANGFLGCGSATDAPLPVFQVGEIVAGRFRVIRFHGQGGMGEVYEVYDERLRMRVGLKTIRSELAADLDARDGFAREIQMARAVVHPNLCRVFGRIEHIQPDGGITTCLSMEWLDGETLQMLLERCRPLRLDQAHKILTQVAQGLDALHRANIIHRDLKPGNIMLVPFSGGGQRAVITDFGLAKFMKQGASAELMEPVQDIRAGAPYFMAPEVLRDEVISKASDIYAFGLVTDECVTKCRAFSAGSLAALCYQRLWEEPITPSSRADALPIAWEEAILGCLATDPASRPLSATEVIERLSTPCGGWVS